MTTRRATHAGSWYTSNGKSLSKELDGWLQAASAKVSLDRLPSSYLKYSSTFVENPPY